MSSFIFNNLASSQEEVTLSLDQNCQVIELELLSLFLGRVGCFSGQGQDRLNRGDAVSSMRFIASRVVSSYKSAPLCSSRSSSARRVESTSDVESESIPVGSFYCRPARISVYFLVELVQGNMRCGFFEGLKVRKVQEDRRTA